MQRQVTAAAAPAEGLDVDDLTSTEVHYDSELAARASGAFALFDAREVSAGPLATLWLDEPVHFGFHAAFRPDARHD